MKNRVKKHLMTLQDVIGIVSRFSRNDYEVSLVVADLLNRVMFFDCVPYNHWIFKSAYVSFAALVVMTFVVAPPRRARTHRAARPPRRALPRRVQCD